MGELRIFFESNYCCDTFGTCEVIEMSINFWYWLILLLWVIFGGVAGYRRRAEFGPYYWGAGWGVVLFLLLLIIGLKIFPDPFGTLVK